MRAEEPGKSPIEAQKTDLFHPLSSWHFFSFGAYFEKETDSNASKDMPDAAYEGRRDEAFDMMSHKGFQKNEQYRS